VAEAFRDRGYATAGFVANPFYTAHDSGIDRGFTRYRDYRVSLTQVYWSTTLAQTETAKDLYVQARWNRSLRGTLAALGKLFRPLPPVPNFDRKTAAVVNREFLAWQAETDRPFFAFLNYFDAHEKYAPPPRYRQLFSRQQKDRDLYDACIRYLDDEIDRLLRELDARGALRNTVVVVTSDHGEYFGEHGQHRHGWEHATGMHREVLQVPLVFWHPARVPAGRRIPEVVSLRDLAATLTDLADIPRSGLDGSSLARYWTGAGPAGSAVAVSTLVPMSEDGGERPEILSVFSDDYHWIRGPGWEELYAYRRDPAESRNVAAVPAFAPVKDSLRALVEPRAGTRAAATGGTGFPRGGPGH
jgi:arylsulfatase A-like enzyme